MAQVKRAVAVPAQPRLDVGARLRELVHEIKKHRWSYYFMAPFFLGFFLFTLAPVLFAFYLSFHYFNLLEAPRSIGWTNYKILFLDDDIFMKAVRNTVIFSIVYGPVSFIASFLLAWMINQITRLRVVYTLAFYAPSIVSGIAMSVVWLYFLAGDRYGLLNHLLITLGAMDEPFLWLRDVRTTLPSILMVALWMSLGSGFLVFLAGLQNVDPQLYEAGAIDGIRNRVQELWFITAPLLKPQFLFAAVMGIVASFSVFDIAVVLAGLPSHLYAGHTIVAHLFDYAFLRFEMGYASGIAVVLFVLTFGTSRLAFRMFSSRDE